MEIPNVEVGEEMPIPLNSSYSGGHAHMIHHNHHHTNSHNNNNHIIIPSHSHINNMSPPNNPIFENNHPKKMVKYRECLKNHAASMGGNATDGCGEFMPSGEEGSIEALTCSACNCHRNFHRKEIEGADINNQRLIMARSSFHNKGFHHHHHHIVPRHHMMMSYNNNMGGSDQSDDVEEGGGGVATRPGQMMMMVKKRFRTKFSQEQKEKMFEFAEKVGWKIQKQEESVVQQFCQEVGVKRRVLKVWMHNNKHNLAKKNNNQSMNPLNDQV